MGGAQDSSALAGQKSAASGRQTDTVRAALSESGPAVRRYLFGLCGRWDQAEDLAQGALLKAWQKRETFDGRAGAKTWLFRIARNHWVDQLRRKRVRPQEQPMTDMTLTTSREAHPAEAAQRGELARAVAAAVSGLPPEQAEALALRESEGLTFGQIAAVLDVPAATVKSRVRYALLKLADTLKAFAPERGS